MQEWVRKHGFGDDKALLDYAYALSLHYGQAIGALACQMYEKTAAAQGVTVPTAEVADLPEYEEEEPEVIQVVKRKKFELEPMTVDEAIVQMELLAHTFYVFLNMETDSVNVVYRRNDKDYGLLETSY